MSNTEQSMCTFCSKSSVVTQCPNCHKIGYCSNKCMIDDSKHNQECSKPVFSPCKYGIKCYRTTPDHWRNHSHPIGSNMPLLILSVDSPLIPKPKIKSEIDGRGIFRGSCQLCSCQCYQAPTKGFLCAECSHVPFAHENLGGVQTTPRTSPLVHGLISPINVFSQSKSAWRPEPLPCKLCGEKIPVIEETEFCSEKCKYRHKLRESETPSTEPLDPASDKYQELSDQFMKGWKKKEAGTCKILHILAIHPSKTLRVRFETLQRQITLECALPKTSSAGPGNTLRRFHGPGIQKCTIGKDNNTTICDNSECSTCGIIKSGLRLDLSNKNTGFARFGKGLYLTAASSKANDYNTKTSQGLGKNIRSTFILNVICGKVQKLRQTEKERNGPDSGFHSVVGEPKSLTETSILNYDEVVVYKEEQVLAAYLVVYSLEK